MIQSHLSSRCLARLVCLPMFLQEQGRQLSFESAFPVAPTTPRKNRRGVPGTQWVHIDRATYDACRDWKDYRPPKR
jgi:hypothetical protein